MIRPEQMPYKNRIWGIHDVGQFEKMLDQGPARRLKVSDGAPRNRRRAAG